MRTGVLAPLLNPNWSDGALNEQASVSGIGPGKYAVFAKGHRFTEEGNQMFSVTIHARSQVLLAVGTADVLDARIHAADGCNHANLPIGQTQGPGWVVPDGSVVAGFRDDFPDERDPHYSAVIHWGDGQTSSGAIVPHLDNQGNQDGWSVTGGHTYQGLPYAPWVAIKDDDVTRAVTGTMVIIDQGIPNGMCAYPIDLMPTLRIDDVKKYDPGTADDPGGSGVGNDPNNPGDTSSTNTTDTNDPKPPTETTDSTGTVMIVGQPLIATEGQGIYPGTLVGTFTDEQTLSDPNDPSSLPLTAGDYRATLTLPDGTQAGLTVADRGDGWYTMKTSASTAPFAEETTSDQSASIRIVQGDRPAYAGSSVQRVADAPLTTGAATAPLQMQAGQSQRETVATFSDADPNVVVGDFLTSIDWGDGSTPSEGIVQQIAGTNRFEVLGTHNYIADTSDSSDHPGGYAIRTDITDTDGASPGDLGGGRGHCVAAGVAVVAPVGTFTIQDVQLSFTGGQQVLNDKTGDAYQAPQWSAGPADAGQGAPIRYVRSTPGHDSTVTLNVTMHVLVNGVLPNGWTDFYLDAQDSSHLGLAFQGSGAILSGDGVHYEIKAQLTADSALPSTIDTESLDINWSLCLLKDRDTLEAETALSSDQLNVTGAPVDKAFETVLSVGCKDAKGLKPGNATANQAVVNNIWNNFDCSNEGFNVNPLLTVDGRALTYTLEQAGVATTTKGLLAAGKGECDSFAAFLRDVLAAQGVASTMKKMVPTNQQKYPGFRVVAQPAQGTQGELFQFNEFGFHEVLEIADYPDRVYDPTFGRFSSATPTATAEQKYEADTVTDLFDATQNPAPGTWVPDDMANTGHQYNMDWN